VPKQLYSHDAKLNEAVLNDIALRNKLNYSPEEGVASADSQSAKRVHADREVGDKIPVQGTPSLFLCTPDQKVYQITSFEQVKRFIR
jgi:protein-disulfide isomerase